MTDWLNLAKHAETDLFDLIEKLVLIESPTRDKAANDQLSEIGRELLEELGGTSQITRRRSSEITFPRPGHLKPTSHMDLSLVT